MNDVGNKIKKKEDICHYIIILNEDDIKKVLSNSLKIYG